MEQFEYKVMFSTNKLLVSKEMIEANGKTIPSQSIVAIGIEIIDIAKIAIGHAIGGILGGIIGGLIRHGSFGSKNEINRSGSIKDLPNCRGQLVITHKTSGEEKTKVQRIAINSSDPICRKMLEKIVETYKGKFIGFGPQALMEKELKISSKAALIVVIAIVLIVIGLTVFNILESQGYVHY